jgi:hypothetical protein
MSGLKSLSVRVAVVGALASCAAAGVAACSIYGADLLLPAPADGGSDDATSDVADTDAGGDADTCGHARWPDRPAADDPSSTQEVEVIAALATLDIGAEKDGGRPPNGFDLDGVCTCPGPESCTNAAATKAHCDNSGGGDNAGGTLLSGLAQFGSFDSLALNDRLHKGLFGLIVAIRGWNGQPNDRSVTVALYVSNGLSGIEDGGVGPAKGDGTDRWTVDPSTLLGGKATVGLDCDRDNAQCAPAFFDSNAYVAGGQLVGSLDFPIVIGGLANNGVIVLDLTGSVVTARLVKVAAGWSLDDGVLAGRWGSAKLLTSLAALADPLAPGSYLCGADETYVALKRQICDLADITVDPKRDNTNVACDALSMTVAFTATPAHLGEVYDKGPFPVGCADGGAPYHDQCP